MNTDKQPLLLELTDAMAGGREIALTVAGFDVRGQVSLEGAQLHLAGRDGTVTADRLIITNVTVMGHGVRVGGQALEAANATVSWGAHGLQLRATRVLGRALQVIGDHEPFDGTVVLEGITLTELAVAGNEVQLEQLSVATAKADVAVPARDGGATEPEAATGRSRAMLDKLLDVLDRLTGHVNVDLGLDLTVPVIGRRRATHEFRIPIDAGTIDYRQLEDNLSTLEDSLLDFSVRDEGLVLEVGIPFLPTRGKGKPIVTWSLDEADTALAHDKRVRLSVLTRPNLPSKADKGENPDEAETDDKSSPVSVRKAHAAALDVKLAVAPAESFLVRSVGILELAGDVTYAADESPEGTLRGVAQNVELGAIDAGRVSFAGLRLGAATNVELALQGTKPVRAKLVAENLDVHQLHVAPRSVEERRDASRTAGTASDGAGSGHSHVPHARAK